MLELTPASLAIGLLLPAIFFSLSVLAGLLKLYLRHIDHLSLDKEDRLLIAKHLRYAVLLYLMAWAAQRLPLAMSLALFAIVLLAIQLWRVRGLLKTLRGQRQHPALPE